MERNMAGAKDEQGKTRRREGKEICLVQKNCVERAGLGDGRARGGEQEMGEIRDSCANGGERIRTAAIAIQCIEQ